MKESVLSTATKDDLYPLVDVCEQANRESDFNLPFHKENSTQYLWEYIIHPTCDILICKVEGAIAGGVMIAESKEFHEKAFCYVSKFWVLPEFRRSNAARVLLKAALDWALEKSCSHVFVTATAGLDEKEQRLFINLMKRAKFKEEGPVLCLTL